MKLKQCLSLILCWELLFFVSPSLADDFLFRMEIPSSPNPVGSGARALGMGGAFIAIADDATAASWNPGGLIQLEKPEFSVVSDSIYRTENNSFIKTPNVSGYQWVFDNSLNYLSAALPFSIGEKKRNMILSLNYQRLYDFNREWHFDNSSYTQEGSLYALSIAYCAQITIDFSIGFTLNYWGDFLYRNKWEQKYYATMERNNAIAIRDTKDEFTFQGWNANFGFLWRINDFLTLGGVFKTPFTADIEHTVTGMYSTIYDKTQPNNSSVNTKSNETLNMPMSYGIGVACRFSDEFTLSADIYKTHWNDFEYQRADGKKVSPLTGKDSDIHPAIWVRLGAEYLIVREKIVVPLRFGIFYDPAPAEGSSDDYYGFSMGSGLNYNRFSFDIAYQFRFGNNVGASMLQNLGFSQDVYEHTIYSSLIFYF